MGVQGAFANVDSYPRFGLTHDASPTMNPINPLFLARYGLEAQALGLALPKAYVRVDGIEDVWRPELFSGLINQGGNGLLHLQQYKGGRCWIRV